MPVSAGHQLAEQSRLVETKIKTLLNNDLRLICKAYNQVVSGTKVTLQGRCLRVLENIVNRGDIEAFNLFVVRVHNHGSLPPGVALSSARDNGKPSNASAGLPSQTPSSMQRPQQSHGHRPDFRFRASPFYEFLDVVVRAIDLPEMPQNRHTVKTNLILTEDQARRLSSDPEQYRLMLYCGLPNLGSYNPIDVAFPPQIEVKVNEDDVKANFKGLKNKPGTTKPADITKLVRARVGYMNKLSVCYALTTKRYIFTVAMVRYVNTSTLTQRIRTARVFPKAKVLEEYARKNADLEIVATSSKMSLKDPISTLRISMPVRSTVCDHNQCFDASFYLQLQEQAPTWLCPICNKALNFDMLGVDKYFEEILQNTPKSIAQVTIEPSGEWAVIQDDQEKSMSNAAKQAPRAAYDDDFDDDDDVVEVDADSKATTIKKENPVTQLFSTPPSSSREPSIAQSQSQASKRTSTVIDLTLSDDEDEPVRPAKRVRVGESTSQPVQMQTPTSLQDLSFNLSRANPQDHNRPATVASSRQSIFSNPFGRMQPPTVPPMTHSNLSSTAAFDRPSNYLQRQSSHSSTTSLPGLHDPRSPTATFGSTGADFAQRWSTSKSPTGFTEADRSDRLGYAPPGPAGQPVSPPMLPSISSVSSYLGFAPERTAQSPPSRNTSSNLAPPYHRPPSGSSR